MVQALSHIRTKTIPVSNSSFLDKYKTIAKDASLFMLEKAMSSQGGKVTLNDISKALMNTLDYLKRG